MTFNTSALLHPAWRRDATALRAPAFMDHFFDAFFDTPALQRDTQFAPQLDLVEDKNQYRLSVELPGVRKEDVTLNVFDKVLTLRGEKNRARERSDDAQSRWRERRFGSFERSLRLPADADPERVEASFSDGVLEITIEKRAEAQPRGVEIR